MLNNYLAFALKFYISITKRIRNIQILLCLFLDKWNKYVCMSIDKVLTTSLTVGFQLHCVSIVIAAFGGRLSTASNIGCSAANTPLIISVSYCCVSFDTASTLNSTTMAIPPNQNLVFVYELMVQLLQHDRYRRVIPLDDMPLFRLDNCYQSNHPRSMVCHILIP